MISEQLGVGVTGHCKVVDDLGNVLIDKTNAIHPQNIARVIARALANEHNYFINRIAFGNGGTEVDAGFNVSYRPANDGQSPDVATWDSRIYNETYSEIVDDGLTTLNPLLGTDPGSADTNTGVRSGGGSDVSGDPTSVVHVSGPGVRSVEVGKLGQVIVTCVLNGNEPKGQFALDNDAASSTNDDFVFDEIGLYTGGAAAIATNGYAYVDVGIKTSGDETGLLAGTTYTFTIAANGGSAALVSFTTPLAGGSGSGGAILYGDFCQALNTGAVSWGLGGTNPMPGGTTVSITDLTNGSFSTITGAQTFGYLKFTSGITGAASSVIVSAGSPLFASGTDLNSGVVTVLGPVAGKAIGVRNAPAASTTERERLLAHLIFSPVLKAKTRTLTITYTLTVSVARTIA